MTDSLSPRRNLIKNSLLAGFGLVSGSALISKPAYATNDAASIDWVPNTDIAVTRKVSDKLKGVVSVNDFYASAMGSNWGPAIRKAIETIALRGGGVVTFEQSDQKYNVTDTVFIPSNITIDLNGQTLNGINLSNGVLFETGYLSTNEVISNTNQPPETKIVNHACIRDGRIINCKTVFKFFNFNLGCSVENIYTENCKQVLLAKRCFYSKYSHITASGGSDINTPTFLFSDNTNAVNITRLTATTEFGILFEGGTSSTVMTNCTTEGGAKGIKFKGDILGFTLEGHYFENMPAGGTALDFTEAGACHINFKSNYFNLIDVVFDDGGENGTCTLFGTWDETNNLANVGATYGTNPVPFRGLLKVSGPRNFIKYQLKSDHLSPQTIPENWLHSKLTHIEYISNYGGTSLTDVRAKSLFSGAGIIPVRRGGDIGDPYPNTIPFSTHYALFPGSSNITVVVDTAIKWQPNSLFAKFCFRITDASATYFIYGDVYGSAVKQWDTTGKTVTILANTPNNLQFRVSGFAHPNGSYSCTGSVQIVG